jgi:hypothetical protein
VILIGINRQIQMREISKFAAALTRHAPATPGRTALVGHWQKNEQTGRLECHWSLEPASDEAELLAAYSEAQVEWGMAA